MKLDSVVLRRFEELQKRADEIVAAGKPWTERSMGVSMVINGSLEYDSDRALGWGANARSLLARVFGTESEHYQLFKESMLEGSRPGGWIESGRAIFAAAREDYEGGYLFSVRSLVTAEAACEALNLAHELLVDHHQKDLAAILGRIALEVSLKELAAKHGIAEVKLDTINHALRKTGAYNLPQQQLITAWAAIGNGAAHGKWNEYTEGDVTSMVAGIRHFIADHLN